MEKSLNKQKLVLFDIDYTLFNTSLYRNLHYEKLADAIGYKNKEEFISKCHEIYLALRQRVRYGDHELFITELRKQFPTTLSNTEIEKIILDEEIMEKSIYEETISVLQELSKKNVTIGLFSTGAQKLQRTKVRLFSHLLTEEHIHIAEDKMPLLPQILGKYHDRKVYLVDDYLDILTEAKKHHPDITTVWMKRGRHAEKIDIPPVEPDYTITDLSGVLEIIN